MFVYADILCSSKEEIFDIWKSGDMIAIFNFVQIYYFVYDN